MKKTILVFVISLLTFTYGQSQDTDQATDSNSLEAQFEDVFEKSNSYQDYKVIKKFKLARIRANILDSIARLEGQIETLYSDIEAQKSEIAALKAKLSETESALASSREKQDGISLFGMLLKKSTYNVLLWSIIAILLLTLLFFLSKYRISNRITQEAKNKLAETESEYEGFRQRSLEREQQLRRKLQDELNKNKNSKTP